MRTIGTKNRWSREAAEAYEELKNRLNVDPFEVLFRLCKHRTPSIRLSACQAALAYRFAKQSTPLDEAATQMTLEWLGDEPATADAGDAASAIH